MPLFYSRPWRVLRALLFGFYLLASSHLARAQAPAWQSAVAFQPASDNPYGSGVGVSAAVPDGSGNLYLTGSFTYAADFGATRLTSTSGYDAEVFVAKWNIASAQFVWARRMGGADHDYAAALVVRGSQLYVGGSFRGAATFGSTTLTSPISGYYDVFVARLTDAGSTATIDWAVRSGTTGSSYDTRDVRLAASSTGVYVAANFTGSATLGGTSLASAGGYDLFVAKLTDMGTTGTFTWARQAGGADNDFAYGLTALGNAVYVSGAFSTAATFGPATVVSPTTATDGFVARLTDAGTTGSFAWAQRVGGNENDYAYGLAATAAGVYLTGTFVDKATFGSVTLTGDATKPTGFITKLFDTGTASSFAWTKPVGSSENTFLEAVAVQGPNVYVKGSFYQKTTVGTTQLTAAGGYDLLLAKLLDAGPTASFAWAQQAGGPGSDGAASLGLSGGSVYVVGGFTDQLTFGSLTLTTAMGNSGGYFATLADASLLATTAPAASPLAAPVYPNPAHGRTTVARPAGLGAGPATLTLLDALGRVVRTAPPTLAPTAELDLTGVAPGVYALRVAVGPATAVSRLVVE